MNQTTRKKIKEEARRLDAELIANDIYHYSNHINRLYEEMYRDKEMIKITMLGYSVGRMGTNGRIDMITYKDHTEKFIYFIA